HNALLARIEPHAFFAVCMAVAEETGLPATKTVPRHGHRDRHIDADHSDFDTAPEFTRYATIAGEQAHPVCELMGIDELDRIGKALHTDAGKYRSKDFFLVDAHVRR